MWETWGGGLVNNRGGPSWVPSACLASPGTGRLKGPENAFEREPGGPAGEEKQRQEMLSPVDSSLGKDYK